MISTQRECVWRWRKRIKARHDGGMSDDSVGHVSYNIANRNSIVLRRFDWTYCYQDCQDGMLVQQGL